jgi:hypothetical protein
MGLEGVLGWPIGGTYPVCNGCYLRLCRLPPQLFRPFRSATAASTHCFSQTSANTPWRYGVATRGSSMKPAWPGM